MRILRRTRERLPSSGHGRRVCGARRRAPPTQPRRAAAAEAHAEDDATAPERSEAASGSCSDSPADRSGWPGSAPTRSATACRRSRWASVSSFVVQTGADQWHPLRPPRQRPLVVDAGSVVATLRGRDPGGRPHGFLLLAGTEAGATSRRPARGSRAARSRVPCSPRAWSPVPAPGYPAAVLYAFAAASLFGSPPRSPRRASCSSTITDSALSRTGALRAGGARRIRFVVNQRAFQAARSRLVADPHSRGTDRRVADRPDDAPRDPLHDVPSNGSRSRVPSVAMVAATVALSRSAARHDMIHEHELADVLTRGERDEAD